MPQLRYPDPPLTDGAIALRPFSDADVPALVAACQDPEIPRWTRVPSPYTEVDAREWLATHRPQLEEGRAMALAVTDTATGSLLGSIGVVGADHEPGERRVEVGYWLAREARGRGHMTAALRLLTRWLLSEAGFARVQLLTDVDNLASQAVAERAGFTREGVLREWEEIHGARRDFVSFSFLPRDLV